MVCNRVLVARPAHLHQVSGCRLQFPRYLRIVLVLVILGIPSPGSNLVLACGPGRGGGRRPTLRKLTPLVFKQHVPNVSENTLPASGLSEGRVSRHDSRFRDLVPNYNTDIIFKDEEGTGADRLMTQRCKEKLNTLAISVMNQWPGVKLRVTEGWDEEDKHATDSLHYEGRAVDVTTSDRDRSKYGMLARLAVEAGFDWVYYESRSHIHCSVKSESSSAGKSGGCFPGKSIVRTKEGTKKRLDQLTIGEEIASLNSNGDIVYSEVISFMDRQPTEKRQFIQLTTATGKMLTLTPSHLLPVEGKSIIFAARVQVGDKILVRDSEEAENMVHDALRYDRIIEAKLVLEEGVFAPLTNEGTVLIDDVVASCYAIIESQTIAHYSFIPYRFWTYVKSGVSRFAKFIIESVKREPEVVVRTSMTKELKGEEQPEGVLWYASMLYTLSAYVVPSNMMY